MNEIIMINIAGDDRPGVTSSITGILADHEVTVLDIGQAVIHDSLSLGLLVSLPAGTEAASILKDVLFRCHEMQLQVRFLPVEAERYQQWVAGQGKQRHIVTLLARKISARHIARVTEIVSRYGLNIDRIDRLSGRVPLEGVDEQAKASVELSVRGNLVDASDFRRELLQLASAMDIDIAYQEDSMFRRTRRLVAFDMDSTLIEAEVIDELARAAGVGEQVVEITERAMRGELDFAAALHERVALLKGLPDGAIDRCRAERVRVVERGRSPRFVLGVWCATTVLLALAVVAGRYLFAGAGPQALAWPLAYVWPVQRIGAEHRPALPPDEPTCLLVWRDGKDQVRFMQLTPFAYQLALRLQAGEPPLQAQLALATVAGLAADRSYFANARALLEDWQARDIWFPYTED
mgnify:CR=1 FL=1